MIPRVPNSTPDAESEEDSDPNLADRDPEGSQRALVVRAPDAPRPWDDVETQQLWLATQPRGWRSLALVGAHKGLSTVETASRLAQIAWWYGGEATSVFDLREISPRLIEHQIRSIHRQVEKGDRVFIALRSVDASPTSVPLARAADAAILCVALGETHVRSAERTVNAIGRDRFIGSILVREERAGAGKVGAAPKERSEQDAAGSHANDRESDPGRQSDSGLESDSGRARATESSERASTPPGKRKPDAKKTGGGKSAKRKGSASSGDSSGKG